MNHPGHQQATQWPEGRVVVIGIGEDGTAGLGRTARELLAQASTIIGSSRQLALVEDTQLNPDCHNVAWPSPWPADLAAFLQEFQGQRLLVLASGDPTFHGIGSTLVRLLGPTQVHIIPAPSSVSLACARLGWNQTEVTVVSLVTNPVSALTAAVQENSKVIVLFRTAASARDIAQHLATLQLGQQQNERQDEHSSLKLSALSHLGGPQEVIRTFASLEELHQADLPGLTVLAIEQNPAQLALRRRLRPTGSLAPGLPDDSFQSLKGQLTKSDIRAITVAACAPTDDDVMWDIGGGSGSIAIECARLAPRARITVVERDPAMCELIARNCQELGVSHIRILGGAAPAVLPGIHSAQSTSGASAAWSAEESNASSANASAGGSQDHRPTLVFIGGGLTAPGMIEKVWRELAPGGRLVVNGVVAETQLLLWQMFTALNRYAGPDGQVATLREFSVKSVQPVGSFHALKPALAVLQLRATKRAGLPDEWEEIAAAGR